MDWYMNLGPTERFLLTLWVFSLVSSGWALIAMWLGWVNE